MAPSRALTVVKLYLFVIRIDSPARISLHSDFQRFLDRCLHASRGCTTAGTSQGRLNICLSWAYANHRKADDLDSWCRPQEQNTATIRILSNGVISPAGDGADDFPQMRDPDVPSCSDCGRFQPGIRSRRRRPGAVLSEYQCELG